MMVPQIMSVIQMHFVGPARAKALSAYAVVISAGIVASLVVGSLIVSADILHASWRPVFLINVPLGLGVAILVPDWCLEMRCGRQLDLRGLAIYIPAACLVVVPLVLGPEVHSPAWTYTCIVSGLVLIAVFVITEKRVASRGGDPLVDLVVLRSIGFTPGLLTLACMQIAVGGFLFTFTLHLEDGLGYSALRAGGGWFPLAALFGLVGFFWRRLPERLHPMVVPVGMALCALGYLGVALALGDSDSGGLALWACLATLGVGMGLSASPLLTQALIHVPMPRAADASGLLTTTMQLSQLMGVTSLGTIFLTLRHGALHQTGHVSSAAMSTTAFCLASVSLLGVAAAAVLARSLLHTASTRSLDQHQSPLNWTMAIDRQRPLQCPETSHTNVTINHGKGNIMSTDDQTDSVLNVIQTVYDAWGNNDADAFAELYAEDATVVQTGVHKKNQDEIRTSMAAAFAGPLKGSRVLDEPQSIRFLGSEAAVVITEGGILMAGETELPSNRLVRATWVLTRRGERWRVAAYQNSPAS